MSRWMWFLPLIGFVAVAGGLAFLLGMRAATTTETDVIERVALAYIEEAGAEAALSDCKAIPAQSQGLWLVVICQRPAGPGVEYFIDRFGRVADRRALN
ncbi:MAG: hypothetical protein AAF686_09370 [Pseudomonadota bacterium]